VAQITIWLHLFGVALALGANIYFVFVLWPASKKIEDPVLRVKIIADHLQYYHPLFLFGICLTFMTGAIRLTDLKIGFGGLYYGAFGSVLMIKFFLTTLIFLIAGGQCFGMGLKVQRMANGVIEGTLERREKLAGLIRKMALYNIVLIAVTLYFGLKLIPIIYGGS
jgi:uncharacterized membrane protein